MFHEDQIAAEIPVLPTEIARLHKDDVVQGLPASENNRFYPALDGLRAAAVLMVLYEHYLSRIPALHWGWTGVDFFFVLSGFLITGILYDTRNAAHRFRNFYVRRTLRIFPLYYGVLLLALLLTPVFHWIWHPALLLWPLYLGNYARFLWLNDWLHNSVTVDHLLAGPTFSHHFVLYVNHFWSLCVEEQFYLVWPVGVYLIKDRIRLRNLCLTICALTLATRIICVLFLPKPYLDAQLLYRLTPLRSDALLLGGAVALMLRGPEVAKLTRLIRPAFWIFVIGFLMLEVFYRISLHHLYNPAVDGTVLSTIGYTLIDIFAAIIILLSLNPNGLIYRIFTLRWLRRLGEVSYGFYVFHDIPHVFYAFVCAHFLKRFMHVKPGVISLATAALALVCTLAISFVSFRFLEAPFLRLKNRYTLREAQELRS
jgi:peptidoglycan/LPS O-acetylase OafA/YrhL